MALDSDLKLPPAAPVVDEVQLLSPGQKSELTETLRGIKRKANVEITIFITSSLQDHEIADYANTVATKWNLGRKKEDRGLLILIAPQERKMRFEVGYGMEGDLTDAETRRIQDNILRPYFRKGQYYNGLVMALLAIQEKVPLGLDQAAVHPARSHNINWPQVLLILLVVFIILIRIRGGGGYYSSGWGGGGGWGSGGSSSGGDSWGGGGGGFGGGGSSSDW